MNKSEIGIGSRLSIQLKFFGIKGFHSVYSKKKPRVRVKALKSCTDKPVESLARYQQQMARQGAINGYAMLNQLASNASARGDARVGGLGGPIRCSSDPIFIDNGTPGGSGASAAAASVIAGFSGIACGQFLRG